MTFRHTWTKFACEAREAKAEKGGEAGGKRRMKMEHARLKWAKVYQATLVPQSAMTWEPPTTTQQNCVKFKKSVKESGVC